MIFLNVWEPWLLPQLAWRYLTYVDCWQTTAAEIMSSDSDGAVKYMINPEVVQQMQQKQHRSNEHLVPNQAIDVVTKDPAFDLR